MTSQDTPRRVRLFALIDGAASPATVLPLLEDAGVDFRSVYAGLPEEELGPAALFLAPIDDPDADWVTELDRIDRHLPCLSLVWSRVGPDDLITHLQSFLFAEIGDGMTAMVRFFDPRNTGAVFKVWGDKIMNYFLGPIERWMYRGRYPDWQRVENDSLTGARICKSTVVTLDQADIDALTAHSEPDELLASLIERGLIDGARPYLERHSDFMPRYRRALHWGLTEPADRLLFCQRSYEHGPDFDEHPYVQDALARRGAAAEPFRVTINRIPSYVWADIARKRGTQTGTRQ